MPIICLAGPTAAGKSAATLAIAARWPVEIINVDSATIYRGMDIGTAKPTPAEQAAVPHHLIDIRDPSQSYSAAQFREDATALIADIKSRQRLPLLCGGTMLYYKALREGLNDLPSANPIVRDEIEAEAKERGWPAMHAELARFDPVTAARLAPNDSQRVQRALEVYRTSGRPLSEWLTQSPVQQGPDWQYVTISLEPGDRSALHQRIADRYHAMLEAGLLEEVQSLHARPDLHLGLPSMRCVGYRQLWEHLDGLTPLDVAVERAIAATRQLAKRQLTWLRSQPDRHQIDCLDPDAASQVVDVIAKQWDTALR